MIDDQALASKFRQFVGLSVRIEDRMMKAEGVTLAQSRLLEVIQETPRARWSDIATVLGYSPRTITEAIDSMERDGLVARSPDPNDRRAKILTITRKGARDLKNAQKARDRVRGIFFGVLAEDERVRLFEMLERMREAVRSLDDAESVFIPN
jgi:DNA-binding MarR family transcriptional regulator